MMLNKSKDKLRILGITDYKDYQDDFKEINRISGRCIIIEEGKIYLSYSKKYDYYKLPGGGINKNESKRIGAAREALEEVGVNVDHNNMILYGVYIDKWKSTKQSEEDMVWVNKSYYYICTRVGDVVPIKPTKSEKLDEVEMRFVTIDEALKANYNYLKKERFIAREIKVLELIKEELL